MTDARALIGRVHVEPLSRDVLAGVVRDRAGTAGAEPKADQTEDRPEDPAGDRPAAGSAVEPTRTPLDVGVLPVFSDERPLTGLAAFLDWRASGKLSALLRRQWWTGAFGECVLVPAGRTLPVRRIVLFGLGASTRFDTERAGKAASAIVGVVARLAPREVLFAMPGRGQERAVIETIFQAALASMCARVEPSDLASGAAVREGSVSDGAVLDRARPVQDVTAERGSNSARAAEATCTWWVIADPRHVARLRRVLEGPPRAAGTAG